MLLGVQELKPEKRTYFQRGVIHQEKKIWNKKLSRYEHWNVRVQDNRKRCNEWRDTPCTAPDRGPVKYPLVLKKRRDGWETRGVHWGDPVVSKEKEFEIDEIISPVDPMQEAEGLFARIQAMHI